MEFVDLDLLFQIPQEYARIIGGIERKGKLFKVNNGGESRKNSLAQGGRRGPFIPPITKHDRWSRRESLQTKTGLSGPDRNSKTKTAITFASGLRF